MDIGRKMLNVSRYDVEPLVHGFVNTLESLKLIASHHHPTTAEYAYFWVCLEDYWMERVGWE